MSLSSITSDAFRSTRQSRLRWLDWRRLALVAGVAVTAATVGLCVYLSEGGIVAAIFVVSTRQLVVRRGLVGAIGLLALAGVTYYFMITAALAPHRSRSQCRFREPGRFR